MVKEIIEEAPEMEIDIDKELGFTAQKRAKIPAKVQKVLSDCKVVINKGSMDGIKKGQRFLVYNLSEEEIKDIDTNESLGFLEIIVGTGIITHVQEKMATLESDQKINKGKRITRSDPYASTYSGTLTHWWIHKPDEKIVEEDLEDEIKPFDNAQRGDRVRPI